VSARQVKITYQTLIARPPCTWGMHGGLQGGNAISKILDVNIGGNVYRSSD